MYINPLSSSNNKNIIFTAKYPKLDLELAKKFMAENKTQSEFADIYGVSVSCVSRTLKRNGIKWRRAGLVPYEELKRLVESCKTITEIAKECNCSLPCASRLLKVNGLSKANEKENFLAYFKKIIANEITQKEVADIFNKTPETIRRWIKDIAGTGKKKYNQITVLDLLKKGYTNDEVVEVLGVAKSTARNVRYKYKNELEGYETSLIAERKRYQSIVENHSKEILDKIHHGESVRDIAKCLGVPIHFVEDFCWSDSVKVEYRKALFSGSIEKKVAFVKERMAQGYTALDIAREMGKTRSTVYRYSRMANLNKDLHKQTILNRYKDLIEPVLEKHSNGDNMAEISRELKIPVYQVKSILLHMGKEISKSQ